MRLEYGELTSRVIAAAIEVHRRLGPGFLESIYENALVVELRKQGLKAEQQVEVTIEYDRVEVGQHRLDLLVEGTIVVELKGDQEPGKCPFCHCKVIFEGNWEGARIAFELYQTHARGKEGNMSRSQIISWFPGFLIVKRFCSSSG